jgi:HK97 family phage prohead protease
MFVRKLLRLEDASIKFLNSSNADAPVRFAGYASTFGNTDLEGDVIQRGAFSKVISAGAAPKMFFNHKAWNLPIGKWPALEEDDHGLRVEAELTPKMAEAESVGAALRHGTVDGLSIAFTLEHDGFEPLAKGRLIKSVASLPEISVVTWGMNPEARIDLDSVKSELSSIETIGDLEVFLRDAGGLSKRLATAVTSRAREILRRDASGPGGPDLSKELVEVFASFKFPDGLTPKP